MHIQILVQSRVQLVCDCEFHRMVYGWARRRDPEGTRKSPDGSPLRAINSQTGPSWKTINIQTGPSRKIQRQLQRQAEGCHPRAFLGAPCQSFFIVALENFLLAYYISLAKFFSHLTPPRIYIFPRPHLSRPTPTFLETPPGASHLPAATPHREVSEACSPCSSLLAFGLFQLSTWWWDLDIWYP